jgi:hypothetical protein
MIVGICGREGAGKTTVADYLTENTSKTFEYFRIDGSSNVENYIMDCLFEFSTLKDDIWNLTREEAKNKLLELFRNYIDSEYVYPENIFAPCFAEGEESAKWVAFSFADPLKLIASAIFELDYEMLLGSTENSRKSREITFTKQYNKCGKLSGRQCLEFLGTNIFREHFDPLIWVKIFHQKAENVTKKGVNIVIPDVRFKNEMETINELGGSLWVIYRNINDLLLTEEDKKSHPSKWLFLTFLDDVACLKKIENGGSIKDLKKKIDELFS